MNVNISYFTDIDFEKFFHKEKRKKNFKNLI